jgi:inner membrane transporter RhtA
VNGGDRRVTAVALVLGGISSVQFGAAVAIELFDEVGPVGTVMLRLVLAALVLMVVWRPSLALLRGPHARLVILFGAALAGMNTSFYLALDRIPLGIAVTLEFVGPLGIAFALTRSRAGLLWAALAAAGILLLSPDLGDGLGALGAALALLAGAFWAAYILLAERAGRAFSGGDGLALAMLVASVLIIPAGVIAGGSDLLDARVVALGLVVAMLSSAIPYSLELEALRRIPRSTFGVLMSLEPAMAALVGFVALGQDLAATEVLAIALVVAASAGALRAAPPPAEG